MSFASDAKLEVLNNAISGDCCSLSFLSAVLACAGLVKTENQKKYFEVTSDFEQLFPLVNGIVSQYYGEVCTHKVVEENNVFKSIKYKIEFPVSLTERLSRDLGLDMNLNKSTLSAPFIIPSFIVSGDCCKQAYLKGVFVIAATSNIVIKEYSNIFDKNNSGYHLEFIFTNISFANEFLQLLKKLNIKSKITFRKKIPIVYIKEYQIICDVLALVGASVAVLQLQNEAAIRDLRNNVNRQTNCLNANLTKTVNASIKQLDAIKIIQENVGLESLSDELMELALIRIANPHESLDTLRKLYKYPISKSGIYHRLNKLVEIAQKIERDRLRIFNL